MPDGSAAPDWWVSGVPIFVDDYESGFKGDMWASRYLSSIQISRQSIFTNDTLVREPHKLASGSKYFTQE